MTTCHLPERLVRDSVPRVWTEAGAVGTSRSLVLQVQMPGRKAGVEHEPDGFGSGFRHGEPLSSGGGGGTLQKPPSPVQPRPPCKQPSPAERLRPAVLTPSCTLSCARVVFKWHRFFLLQNGVCALLEKCIKYRLQKEEEI